MYGHPGVAGQNSEHGWGEGANLAYRPWESGVAYAQNTNEPFIDHTGRNNPENAYQIFSPQAPAGNFRSYSQGSINTTQETSPRALGNTLSCGYSSGLGQANHARMFLEDSGQHGMLGDSFNAGAEDQNYGDFEQRYHNGGYGGHANGRYGAADERQYAGYPKLEVAVDDGYSGRTEHATDYRSEASQHAKPHGPQHYGSGVGFVANRNEGELQPICKQTCARDLAPHVAPFRALSLGKPKNTTEAEDMFLLKLIFRSDGEQLFHTKCVTHAFNISKGRLMRLQKRRAQMAIDQVDTGSGTDSMAGQGLVGRRSNNSKRPETLQQFIDFVKDHRIVDHWEAPGKPVYRLHHSMRRVQGDNSDSLRAQFNTWQRKLSTLDTPRESISSGTAQAWFKKYFKDTLSPCISALSHVNPNNPATVPPPFPKSATSPNGTTASTQSSPAVSGGGRKKKAETKQAGSKKRRPQERTHHHHAKGVSVSSGVVSVHSNDSLGSGPTDSDHSLNLAQLGAHHHAPHLMDGLFNDQLAALAASMAVAAGVKVQADVLRGMTTPTHVPTATPQVVAPSYLRRQSLPDKLVFPTKNEHHSEGAKNSRNASTGSPPSSTDSTTDEREPGGGKIPARRRRIGGVGVSMRRSSPESEVSSRDSNFSLGTEEASEDSWDIRSPGLD